MIKTYIEYINEKAGVSNDTEILAEFLLDFLSEAEVSKRYVFVNPDVKEEPKKKNLFGFLVKNLGPEKKEENVEIIKQLPKISKNLYKVIITYSTKPPAPGVIASFDPNLSKFTSNGYILYFNFYKIPDREKIWKHHVYHEVHHGIQFMNMGKKNMLGVNRNIKVGIMRSLTSNPLLQQFIQFLYYTIKNEQGAYTISLYGKLKHKKKIKRIEDLQEFFIKKDAHEFVIAKQLANCDLNKLFSMKGIDMNTGKHVELLNRESLREFFTFFKSIGNRMRAAKSIDGFLKELSIQMATKPKSLRPKKEELISDAELDATIKGYQEHFRRTGRKMMKKMDRIYSALYDHYTDKFEKEKINSGMPKE